MGRATVTTKYWHRTGDGRVQCDVCPRECRLQEGQRGFCFVRMRQGDAIVLTTYGRSSGYCVDPIEKKPLNHFLPGSPVLSFGTAGCKPRLPVLPELGDLQVAGDRHAG
jgi:pyruvate formate lyase activating enzyme